MTSNHVHDTTTVRLNRCSRLDAIFVVVLIAYFLHFALPARHGGFREDEMMNLWTYWNVGAFQSLSALAKFWTPNYRPGGALYYLPLYHFFGLNPLPHPNRDRQINKLTPGELARVSYIISLTEFEATVIRSPNGQKAN